MVCAPLSEMEEERVFGPHTSVQGCSIHRYIVQDKTGTVIRSINLENGRERSHRAVVVFAEECVINADIRYTF